MSIRRWALCALVVTSQVRAETNVDKVVARLFALRDEAHPLPTPHAIRPAPVTATWR